MKSLRFLKERQIVIVQSLVVMALASGLVVLLQTKSAHAQSASTLQTQEQSSGPALGEVIDLASFRSRSGRTLADTVKGHSLAMVVLINPTCGTCASEKENMRTLRDKVGKPGIAYYVLMIPTADDAQKYFSYADSLNLEVESFVWSSADSKPPSVLVNLAVPSHLLLSTEVGTTEGRVVNKWPGGSIP